MTWQSVQLLIVLGLTNLCFWLLWPASIIRVEALGWGETVTGLFGSAVWFSTLITLALVPRILRYLGFRATTGLSCLLFFIAGLGSCLLNSEPLEWLWTCLLGVALGLRWAPVDAWIADIITPETRGRTLSLNETIAGGTFALGPGIAAGIGALGNGLALTCVVLLCTLVGFFCCWGVPEPAPHSQTNDSMPSSITPLSSKIPSATAVIILIAAGFGGIFESGFSAASSLIALANGWSDQTALLAATAVGVGSFLAQYGLGYAADHYGARSVLMFISAVLFVALLLLALWTDMLIPVSVIVGAAGGGLYTIAVVLGLQVSCSGTGSSATLISSTGVAYTVGTIVSPFGTGVALAAFGPKGIFGIMAFISFGLYIGLSQLPKSGLSYSLSNPIE